MTQSAHHHATRSGKASGPRDGPADGDLLHEQVRSPLLPVLSLSLSLSLCFPLLSIISLPYPPLSSPSPFLPTPSSLPPISISSPSPLPLLTLASPPISAGLPSRAQRGSPWTVDRWLEHLGILHLCAGALLPSETGRAERRGGTASKRPGAPAEGSTPEEDEDEDEESDEDESELAHIRRLAALSPEARKAEVLQRLQSGAVLDQLAEAVCAGLADLHSKAHAPSSAYQLHQRFVSDEGAFALAFKHLGVFFDGLKGLVGQPSPQVIASDCFCSLLIAAECFSEDSLASPRLK